jgi:hypothetical protein
MSVMANPNKWVRLSEQIRTMRESKYKTLQQLRAEIIKKVLDKDTTPVNITRCYETLFGKSIPREANEDGNFAVWS